MCSVWDGFTDGALQSTRRELSEGEWSWIEQALSLVDMDDVDAEDLLSIICRFSLGCEKYWIQVKWAPGFPESQPFVQSAHNDGFVFHWVRNEGNCSSELGHASTICDIVNQYRCYAETLNEAIFAINELKHIAGVSVCKFCIEEDDSCVMNVILELRSENCDPEIITIGVDWRNPSDFPRSLISSNSSRFFGINIDDWNPGLSLAHNFAVMSGFSFKVSNDASSTNIVLHSIPCKLDYTGPANVSSYFIQSSSGEDTRAAFRGRGMDGKDIGLPTGYELNLLKERKTIGEAKTFDLVDKQKSFKYWEWDREVSSQSVPRRVISHLSIAKALASD